MATAAAGELTVLVLGVLDCWVVAGSAVVTALGFVTITTIKFFSSILYSLRAISSLMILPAMGKASFPFSDSIFSFNAFIVSSGLMPI